MVTLNPVTILCVISDFKGQDYNYNYYNLNFSNGLILFHERQLKETETRFYEFRVELIKLQFHHKLHTGKDIQLLERFDSSLGLNGKKNQDRSKHIPVLKRVGFTVVTGKPDKRDNSKDNSKK